MNDAAATTSDIAAYGRLDNALLPAFIQAIAQTPAVIALYDPQDHLVYGNPAFARHFLRGLSGPLHFTDIIRHGARQRFGVKIDSGDVERFLADVMSRRRRVSYRAFQTDLVNGVWLWMTETVLDNGYFLTIGTEITPLKQHERLLTQDRDSAMRESLTDALTGLPNRRSLMSYLKECAQQAHEALSVALVDLDHFKAINDHHGHAVGDEVLREFALYCTQQLGPLDCFGRLGGEEFLLIRPQADATATRTFLHQLRGGLPALPRGPGVPPLRYRFSAGIAQFHGKDKPSDALRRADHALYAAKANGRDRDELG